MRTFCAILCQMLLVCSLVACAGSHQLAPGGDAGIDAHVETDAGTDAHVDGNIMDSGLVCPSDLPVWDIDTSCTHEGQLCTSGSSSVCGSAYRCTCESGAWACQIAEPDPACWCGRYPAINSPCNTEAQECLSPVACDPSQPNLLCEGGHWIVDPLNNELCAPPQTCPVDGSAIGTACASEGQRCMQGICCTSAPGVPPRSYTSIRCEGGIWVDEFFEYDCVETPLPVCDEFACGEGLCSGSDVCVAECGPEDGIEYRCIVNDTDDSCETIAARLGRPASSCSRDAAGHATIAYASLCG